MVKRRSLGRTTTFQTPGRTIENVSFDDDLNEQGESYRMRTMLDPGGDHLREMLRTGDEELTILRTTTDADANLKARGRLVPTLVDSPAAGLMSHSDGARRPETEGQTATCGGSCGLATVGIGQRFAFPEPMRLCQPSRDLVR
jgi:hypothetical protein